MLAKVNAYLALNKAKNNELQMPMGMIGAKSMSEYFSELFSYAPSILTDAFHEGDEFERFKITLKFAFSLLKNLTMQDIFQKKPMMPKIGETLEAHFIQQEVVDIFMESDYVEYEYVDLLTLKDVKIEKEHATTYILIESANAKY